MKGHIKQRSAGHFAIVLDTRDPQTGKRRRKWISFSGTLRGARIECARLVTEMKSGAYVDATRETIAAFLDRWIEHMQGQVSPRSLERYAELCRNNIAPLLGAIPLTKLQPANISQAYAKALASGRRDGTGGLSPLTVHHMHRVLREALQQAVRWQLLARNPVDAVRPPKVERKQMLILLGVLCGLRRGEITALRWRSIDLDRGQLSVTASTEQTNRGIREKETKSGKSRTVALPSLIVDELRRHRVAQAEGLLAAGVRLTEDRHVVSSEHGQPVQQRSHNQAIGRFVREHGLAPIPP